MQNHLVDVADKVFVPDFRLSNHVLVGELLVAFVYFLGTYLRFDEPAGRLV